MVDRQEVIKIPAAVLSLGRMGGGITAFQVSMELIIELIDDWFRRRSLS
jgi:hypothetical protein